ncbi:hypothetical protein K8R42_05075 [bacterium]|nr:hypothetical protein [bacterium]
MTKYLFILGQADKLAQEELKAILSSTTDNIEISAPGFILAQTKQKSTELMPTLGGTIKIAHFLDKINNLSELNLQKWLSYLQTNIQSDKKINFGFSLYNGSEKNYAQIKQLALTLKRELKSQGHKTRLVTGQSPDLSSVIIQKNNLVNFELIIIKNNNGWLLGLTEIVQDFEKYGLRDMKRPNRDDESGMLPPKVAQMMINLAGANRQRTFLDPFCGSGTILQEAMLLGYRSVYGSDVNSKAVDDTIANLKWLRETFSLNSKFNIRQIDIKNLNKNFAQDSISLIVSEPFMGDARFVQKQRRVKDLEKTKNELQQLYTTAFQQFKKVLKPDGQVVFIFPIFSLKGEEMFTLDQKIISQLGFKLKKDIVYSRPKQKIQRQITLWKLKINPTD